MEWAKMGYRDIFQKKKKKIKRELRWIMEIEFIRVGIKFLFLTEDKEIKILGGNICINNILFVNVGF